LICNQLDELFQGEHVNQTEAQNKYNLRSKKRNGEQSTPLYPKNIDAPTKYASNKEATGKKNQPAIKAPAHEVREIQRSHSTFSFENEI